MLPNYYTVEEVAKKLKVSMKTIYRWREEGILKGKKIKGILRFSESELKKLLKENGN